MKASRPRLDRADRGGARQGDKQRFPIKFVEAVTDALPSEYYRVGEEVRSVKRDFGQRKGGAAAPSI